MNLLESLKCVALKNEETISSILEDLMYSYIYSDIISEINETEGNSKILEKFLEQRKIPISIKKEVQNRIKQKCKTSAIQEKSGRWEVNGYLLS